MNSRTVGIRNDHYGIVPVYYASAVFGIIGFIMLSKAINKNKPLEYIGRNSLGILVTHKFSILIFQEIISFTKNMLDKPNTLSGVICGLIVLPLTLLTSLMCTEVIKRIFPWGLGIKRNTVTK